MLFVFFGFSSCRFNIDQVTVITYVADAEIRKAVKTCQSVMRACQTNSDACVFLFQLYQVQPAVPDNRKYG
jgi:hypothetical protein